MIRTSHIVVVLVISTLTSLLIYSFAVAVSVSHLFLNETLAQQVGGSLNPGGQDQGLENQQGAVVGSSSSQCPPNQHYVGSTNECDWDNCGTATPSMYRNTQTGRCVSDCSEVGQLWVGKGNVCVLGEVGNMTATQSPPSGSSVPSQLEGSGNETAQIEANNEPHSGNATRSNLTSSSTPTETIASLAGAPALPYACFSNTFTCYCDGTEDCKQLTASGECKAEVITVEGKPGLGECDWNTRS